MDIAGLSMSLNQISTQNDVGVAILSKALDVNEKMGDSLISMMERSTMEQSVTPHIGSQFDTFV